MNNQAFEVKETIATIYAAIEHQAKLAAELNPEVDISKFKPSQSIYINIPKTDDELECIKSLPSVADYAKITLGFTGRYLDPLAEKVTVTDAHYEKAEDGISIIQNKVMIMVLQGKKVNGFIANLAKLLEKEAVIPRDIGLLSFVPKTANRYKETDAIDEIKNQYMNSKPLGNIGQKVFSEITFFNMRTLSQYDSFLYEGVDTDGNLVTMFRNMDHEIQFDMDKPYRLNFRIKKAEATPYSYGAIVNSVNYVRLTK